MDSMKKLLFILLTFIFLLSLFGCSTNTYRGTDALMHMRNGEKLNLLVGLGNGYDKEKGGGVTMELESPGRVTAACAGTVTKVVREAGGYTVTVRRDDGLELSYVGLLIAVHKEGAKVETGDSLGTARKKDGSYPLVFRVYLGGTEQDPQTYLPS